MGNLKIDFGNTLPLEAKAFSILSKPQSTIVVESLFFLLCDAMYSGPQIFMIYYFPMTFCDYQNYGHGVLSCTVHFGLYMTENVISVCIGKYVVTFLFQSSDLELVSDK